MAELEGHEHDFRTLTARQAWKAMDPRAEHPVEPSDEPLWLGPRPDEVRYVACALCGVGLSAALTAPHTTHRRRFQLDKLEPWPAEARIRAINVDMHEVRIELA